jgi:predicted RNA-binding protein YlxR (DUF448 family)
MMMTIYLFLFCKARDFSILYKIIVPFKKKTGRGAYVHYCLLIIIKKRWKKKKKKKKQKKKQN